MVAALRLRGIRRSWDENTFLRHLAYVLDLARRSRFPEDTWTRSLLQRATTRQKIRKDRAVRPGDLALFALEGALARPTRVLAAVVTAVDPRTIRLVAPLDGIVQEMRMDRGKTVAEDTPIRPCPPQRPARIAPAGKGKKKAAVRPSPSPPAPCRTGSLYLGRVPWEALPGVF